MYELIARVVRNFMGFTAELLTDVRRQLAPADDVLQEARARRDLVGKAAMSFRGMQRSFTSGSLAHGTANCPIHKRDKGLDADCGAVLSRVTHHQLGPDSSYRLGPSAIVEEIRQEIENQVKVQYPRATVEVTKRAIYVEFKSALATGEDPTVDIVIALERKQAQGLWIPNTEKDDWDPSDPEEHTRLLTSDPKSLRVTRARSVRLAKATNKLDPSATLCSFNIEALALMYVADGMSEPQALLALWSAGSEDLRRRLTPDPAGVSAPIKCADSQAAADMLQAAADQLAAALGHDGDEHKVRKHLSDLWPDFVSASPLQESKARLAAKLQNAEGLSVTTSGALSISGGLALNHPRAFAGNDRG